MRTENLARLSRITTSKSDMYYLHYKSFNRDLKEVIDKYGKGRVLDIGCGNKPYEFLFQGKITEYIGCDIVQSNLKKVDVICEATNIPLSDTTFDTVISTQTIEHVADHQGLINEAYRLLKKGGCFILSGPFYWHLHEEPYDFFRFSKYGFEYILNKSGFEVEVIKSNGGMWSVAGQSLIHAFINSKSKNFLLRAIRFFFYRLKGYWLINTIFNWFDKVDSNEINTINYVIVAKK